MPAFHVIAAGSLLEFAIAKVGVPVDRISMLYISTLQLFGPACLAYLPSDVRPMVELGDYLNQEGVFNPSQV